jgi:carbamoyltransferase
VSHAASAFYTSGFTDSGIFTLDASGEKSSSIFAFGCADGIRIIDETMIPSSLGMFYMLITAFLGFSPLNGEFKVMGLSSYGNPQVYRHAFDKLLETAEDGTCAIPYMLREDFAGYIRDVLGPPREQEGALTRRDVDIAAALQECFERCVMRRLRHLKERHGMERMCFAGGCMLNSALNGTIARSGLFDQIYVFPAAGDDGCAVGAALHAERNVLGRLSEAEALKSASLGPAYDERDVLQDLQRYAAEIRWTRPRQIERQVAESLSAGNIVGWFQGRMEFGPRALGNRSILADPRYHGVKDKVNAVKRRESFRPFAPVVLAKHAHRFFDVSGVASSPFMQFVVPARKEALSVIPGVIHVDGSARIQTIESAIDNEPFWRLINAFDELTGIPVLLNTSFNVRGQTIVCTPSDALKCFLSTPIDMLVIENFVITRRDDK